VREVVIVQTLCRKLRLGVRDEDDRWGPPIGEKKRKRK
jgi:hypothetical protein